MLSEEGRRGFGIRLVGGVVMGWVGLPQRWQKRREWDICCSYIRSVLGMGILSVTDCHMSASGICS